jgi:hypothetical protein
MRGLYDRLFMRYAEQHGAHRWGEKTPLHTWHVDAMAKLFPDAVFVGMVRHPGASTVSNMKRFHHRVGRMASHYDRYTREIARLASVHDERFVLLRYEDLLVRTEPTLRALLEWLGEPWSDSVLQHHVVQGAREHQRIEGKSRADDPVDASRIDKWVTSADQDTKKVIRRRLRAIGEFYGYSMKDPRALEPLNDRDAPLTTGREIAARAERFAHLELGTRGSVPIMDQHYNPRKVWLVRNETGQPPAWSKQPKEQAAEDGDGPRRGAAVARRLPAPVRRGLGRAARAVSRGRSRTGRT